MSKQWWCTWLVFLLGCPPSQHGTAGTPEPWKETRAAQARALEDHALARLLYEQGLPIAALSLLDAIVARADHPGFDDAAVLLGELATELSDASQIGAALDRLPEPAIARLPEAQRSRAHYLRGQVAYRTGEWQKAIDRLARVSGPWEAKALVLTALSHVQLRKSVPTVAALTRAIELCDDADDAESLRIGQLARILVARTYYSAGLRVDPDARKITVDREKLGTALRYWSAIDDGGELHADAMNERAWGHMVVGDLAAARADVAAALAAPGAHFPGAEQLDADLLWQMGDKESARRAFRRVLDTYDPVRAQLRRLTDELDGDEDPEGAWLALVDRVLDEPERLPASLRRLLVHALDDRELRALRDHLRAIVHEGIAVSSLASGHLRASIAERAERALDAAHAAAVSRLIEAARSQLAFEAAELADVVLSCERALAAADHKP
jgi:tetratricopeptide (TPR) repeat protein